MKSDYVLVSRWTVPMSRARLWEVIDELLASDDPFVWWPAVHVSGYDGSSANVRASSAFGYALTFTLSDLQTHRPHTLTFAATGDLRGSGVVSFVDAGDGSCLIDIDWRVVTEPGWMRCTGWLLRPVFVAGHHIVMRQGQRHFAAWAER